MSMILDALRKSEAERRRGQAPDLLTEAAPAPASMSRGTRDPRTAAVIGVAAAISALLVFWWLRSSSQSEADTAAELPARISQVTPAQPQRDAALPPLQPRRLSPRPQHAPLPANETTTAKPAALQLPSSLPAPPAQSPSHPAAQPAPQQEQASTPRMEPAASSAPPANPAVFSSPDAPLRLADLSSEDRRQLPALKLSMHMWAPDAAGRFAIIDGARVNEGDRVGDAVVEAIQADGVMLSWHGRRIRLPIR